jgi:hypothetical protein
MEYWSIGKEKGLEISPFLLFSSITPVLHHSICVRFRAYQISTATPIALSKRKG